MITANSKYPSSFILLAMAMGFMLSPESLILLGNGMGIAGSFFLVLIISAMVIHLFTALSYDRLHSLSAGPGSESRIMKEALGSVPAIVLPLCSRVVVVICASTGILATAGYVFNEVFVNWFPNMGFSFCLLGFLLVMNLWSRRISGMMQVIFVVVALSGIIFLSVAGLVEWIKLPQVVQTPDHIPFTESRVIFLGLILFIGFDLAGIERENWGIPPSYMAGSMVAGIIVVGIVFLLWGLVSAHYVLPGRLSETTIPHSIAAREILGQKGRLIMGAVVLAGTCSAVNALLIAVPRMIVGMAAQRLLPSFLGLAKKRAPIPLIILAGGIAAMLALGMAGAPVLEVYTKAGLLFWLLNYSAVQLSVLITGRRIAGKSTLSQIPGYPVITIISFCALISGFVGLLWCDNESAPLLKFMLSILTVVSLMSAVWIFMSRGKERLTPE